MRRQSFLTVLLAGLFFIPAASAQLTVLDRVKSQYIVLKRNPKANLRVYSVWYGLWFNKAIPSDYKGDVQWDAFYLCGADSVWTDQPTSLLTWGRTILKDRNKLREKIGEQQ